MNYRTIAFAFLIFMFGQCLVWFQVNAPILWSWGKTWKWLLILGGLPITWLFMSATEIAVTGFAGSFWPGRFMSFVSGMLIFTILTYMFCNEPITTKTAISLVLALALILIQLFWKS